MSKPWFRPKRFGWGATPIVWQGWVVILAFVGLTIAAFRWTTTRFADRGEGDAAAIAVEFVMLLLLAVVVRAKTEGEWRWRWGGRGDGTR